MNREFLKLLTDKTAFPAEAAAFLLESADQLAASGQEEALDRIVELFYQSQFSMGRIEPEVEKTAGAAGLSPYTLWMLTLIEAAVPTLEAYRQRGLGEQLFFDTFADLRYKAIECKQIHNVWGTFVAFWYPIFYSREIVKLGRLEYESMTYRGAALSTACGYTIQPGDRIRSIHIPSSGEPFDLAARLDSYRMAYRHFQPELQGGPLVCVCHSWLLYPEYARLLRPGSNIADFQQDFEILRQDVEEEFGDAWRLYGADAQKPLSELPENTSMQRAFKQYLLAGNKPGEGFGVLIFDGDRLLTR